jgi:hypothetical protein
MRQATGAALSQPVLKTSFRDAPCWAQTRNLEVGRAPSLDSGFAREEHAPRNDGEISGAARNGDALIRLRALAKRSLLHLPNLKSFRP